MNNKEDYLAGKKGVPLCKAMIVCSPSGYIHAVEAMYKSNGKNNDASITKHMFKQDQGFLSFYKNGDIIIWDRGFRDCSKLADYFGLRTKMPHYLPKNQKQHTAQEANDSRLTTCLRWVVESVNSRLKRRWKFLNGIIENHYLPNLGKYVEICCALTNAFSPPLATDKPEHLEMAEQMLARKSQSNQLQDALEGKRISDARKRKSWTAINAETMEDFPYLTLLDLRAITFGVYQIKLSSSYAAEHLDDAGKFKGFFLNMQGDIPFGQKVIR